MSSDYLEQSKAGGDSVALTLGLNWLLRRAAEAGPEIARKEYIARAAEYEQGIEQTKSDLETFEQLLIGLRYHLGIQTARIRNRNLMASRVIAVFCGFFVVSSLAARGFPPEFTIIMGVLSTLSSMAAVRIVLRSSV